MASNPLFHIGYGRSCYVLERLCNIVEDNQSDILLHIDNPFGDPALVEFVRPIKIKQGAIYSKMIKRFEQEGFNRATHLYGIPMDWRIAVVDLISDYYDKISGVINQAQTATGHSVSLICHSYSCYDLAMFECRGETPLKPIKGLLFGENLTISLIDETSMWPW
uniref:Uncharacterized protein n=1 Tax=Tetranychus urticae TaxID=32264 RepID=T1KBZ9_TETUR